MSLLAAFLFIFQFVGYAQISGDPDVCVGDNLAYTVNAPGAASYLWTVNGGQISGSDNQPIVIISWQSVNPSATINVAVTNGNNTTTNYSYNVVVNPIPKPIIISKFESGCVNNPRVDRNVVPPNGSKDIIDDECFKACENAKIEYYIGFADPLSTYTWTVLGGNVVMQNSNGSVVTIEWTGPVGSAGLIQVTEVSAANCIGMSERCVDIIENPKAIFTVNPNAPQYCLEQSIFFDNMSIGNNLNYLWEFGDGDISTDEDPQHSYKAAGNYTVWLKAYNECGCVDSVSQVVKIIDEPAPEITCISTVCQESFSYYALTNICPGYTSINWVITGGGLISGQGTPSVQVQWYNNAIGIIEAEVQGCACETVARAEVPIITDNLSISGPMVLCVGEDAKFSIPCQPGRKMTWSITGGSVVSPNPHSDEVLVQFNNIGTFQISVALTQNRILRCGENITFTKQVQVVPKAFISPSTNEFCYGDNPTFNINIPGTPCTSGVSWEIFDANQNQIGSTVNGCSITLPTNINAGTYELHANLSPLIYDVCDNVVVHPFKIKATPNPPQFGTGDLLVCLNEPEVYTAIPDLGNIIEWTIIGGNAGGLTVRTGNEISVEWTSLSGSLEIRQSSANGLGCKSLPATINIDEIDPTNYNISGISETCAMIQVPYTFSLNAPASSFNWRLVPEALGSVSNGQLSNTVEVLFQSPANLNFPASVDLICDAVICGTPVTYTHTISLEALEVVLNVPPGPLCEGLPLQLTATNNLSISTSYSWYIDGVLDATTNTPSRNINTNGLSGTVAFSVIATITNPASACFGSTSTSTGQIVILGGPDVSVPSLVHLCGTNPKIISATQQSIPGGNSGFYNYTWTDPSNNPITPSPNPASITLTPSFSQLGVYKVVITDPVNGCSITKYITVDNDCQPIQLCPSNNTFSSSVNCMTASFTSNINIGTIVEWNFGDGATSTLANPIHTYNRAGGYSVSLTILLPNNTICVIVNPVYILMSPDFESHFGCGSGGTRNVQFYDRSEYISGLTGNFTYNWNIVGVGPMTGTTPIANLLPGTYTVELTISYAGAPYSTSCFISHTVVVPDVVSVNLPSMPSVCEGNPVSFANAGSGPISSAFWDFGDGSVSFDPSPTKTYDEVLSNTTYTVTYTVMDNYGCSASGSTTITVLDNTLEGNVMISPSISTAACSQILLTASGPGTITAFNWIQVYDPGTSMSSSANLSITESGIYGVTLTDNFGCKGYQESAPMTIYPSPDPIFVGEVVYCLGETITLHAGLGSDYDYTWTLNGTTNGPSFSYTPSTAGTYNVVYTVTDNNMGNPPGSCASVITIPIVVHPNPTVAIAEPSVCAPGTATVLNPSSSLIYTWSNGDNGVLADVYYESQIQVTAVDVNGCEAKAFVPVSEGPELCNTMVGCYNFCEGGGFSWIGPFGPPSYYSYQWLMMDQMGIYQPINGANNQTLPFGLGNNGSGSYQIEVTDPLGCTDTSGVIDIDITDVCKCQMDLQALKLVCTGKIDANGYPIYDVYIEVANYGLGVNGWNIATSGGTLTNVSPMSIPGGTSSNPSITIITGTFVPDGIGNQFCAQFIGFDMQSGNECEFSFCVDIPECESNPCKFDIEPLEAICIGYRNNIFYYNLDWLMYNYGNSLELLFIKTNDRIHNVSMNSGSSFPGNTTSPMSLTLATKSPGEICFTLYFEDASGEICVYDLCIVVSEDCARLRNCRPRASAEAYCDYQHQIGAYYFNFNVDITMNNPGNWTATLVPIGTPNNALNYTTSITGTNTLSLTGDYVSYGGQAGPCFNIILTNIVTGRQCVIEKVCVDVLSNCSSNARSAVSIDPAIKLPVEEGEINVFPNPTTGRVQIFGLEKENTEGALLEIINYSGRIVGKTSIKREGNRLVNLNLDNLPNGLYLIKIHLADKTITKKLILVDP